ncbi:hypothetical protein VNO77_37334 [Canavalia gladiata]|uniref:Uncharacterized protein n=1 Tax=Canavalia gladiata TaxID=3824 RepID=A0AAN9KBD0_CANGL
MPTKAHYKVYTRANQFQQLGIAKCLALVCFKDSAISAIDQNLISSSDLLRECDLSNYLSHLNLDFIPVTRQYDWREWKLPLLNASSNALSRRSSSALCFGRVVHFLLSQGVTRYKAREIELKNNFLFYMSRLGQNESFYDNGARKSNTTKYTLSDPLGSSPQPKNQPVHIESFDKIKTESAGKTLIRLAKRIRNGFKLIRLVMSRNHSTLICISCMKGSLLAHAIVSITKIQLDTHQEFSTMTYNLELLRVKADVQGYNIRPTSRGKRSALGA